MIAACLAGAIMCAALWFPSRNYDDQQPISVIGRKKK